MAQHIALGSLSHKENRGQFSPTKQVKKLKIELSDRIFELKKLQQDYAQEKAHLIMQFNHERVTLHSTIRELKQKMVEQNQHWTNKIDQLRQQHKTQLDEINQRWKQKVKTDVENQMQDASRKFQAEVSELKRKLNKVNQESQINQRNYQKTINSMKQSFKMQVMQLKQENQVEKQQMRTKMAKDEQLKINAIMHIKNSEQKQHSSTKIILAQHKKQADDTIRNLQQKIFNLGQQIWSLNNKLQKLENQNKNQIQEIVKLQESRRSSVQMSTIQFEQKMQKSEEEWKQNVYSLNEKWKGQYKKLQVAYEKISNACAEKERLWEERGNKVLRLYETREAREEDVKLIEHLQVQLIKKEFQLEREKQQLKFCKLQLDNMDDIYKRIFHSVKKNHRHSHSFQLKKMRLPGICHKSTLPVKGDQD